MRCDLVQLHQCVITKKNISENNEMAEFKKAVEQYQELSKEWAKGKNRDNAKISSHLSKLKMSLTGLTFLPTEDEASTKEAAVCRDTLEIGAQHAVSLHQAPGQSGAVHHGGKLC